jgi:outer membrane protein OmpA-like peptidoglycan-associated protein
MDKWTRTRVVRSTLITLAVSAALAAQPLQAADGSSETPKKASKQETIGVFTGLVLGAVAGGPIGAALGSGAGAWLGDRYHKQLLAKQELTATLDRSEAERESLETQRAKLTGTLERTRDLGAEVDFRTNDASLSSESVERLTRLGTLAGALPDVKIRVCGYADPRGKSGYNLALSQKRAEAVAAVLTQSGVSTERLIIEARGSEDSTSAEGDLDGYALERRVTVQLEGPSDGKLAQAQ